MNIFGRRRKESSQATATGNGGAGGRSLLSASLPAGKKGSKVPTSSNTINSNGSNNNNALPPMVPGKENAPPLQGGLPVTSSGNSNSMKYRAHHATAPAAGHGNGNGNGNGSATQQIHINELGQMQYSSANTTYTAPTALTLPNNGAYSGGASGAGGKNRPGTADGYGSTTVTNNSNNHPHHHLPAIPRDPSSKRDLNKKGLPDPRYAASGGTNRRMSTGSIPSVDVGRLGGGITAFHSMATNGFGGEIAELQLCYGYWPIETHRDLNLVQVEEIVRLCGQEIRTRGIEAPLLFSTKALDITMEGICSLIRAYVGNRDAWRRDLRFSSPHDLCGMIKWALGRYINPQGGRGFLAWEMYERWRFGEREKDFPPRYVTTHMLYLLPTQNAALLTTLFSLMSSALAYTAKNGCTVRKLATLFSSYIFGLPDDGTFEHTYTAFNRFSHATEHLLLAFLRDQIYQHEASGAVMSIPVRLRDSIKDYPACLPRNLNKPPQGAELQQIVRIRRHVRWYSKNLIASAGTWDVPRSKAWALTAPISLPSVSEENKPSQFAYTSHYKHLLNIRNITDEEDEEELQKFSSMVEKEWKSFMYSGFAPPDDSKLKFDLTESDRANRRRKHETIDWTTFESSGFHGREIFLDVDLNFNPGANDPLHMQHKDDLLTEAHAKLVAERARHIEKSLPPFNYDITPREERSIQIDKQFLEVYSDVLCSSGWTREEMKESSWALIQLKTRSVALDRPLSAGSDGRTEETWFLIEEMVPSDYRASLLEQAQPKSKTSRRISFLRPVRKKQSKQPAVPDISGPLGIFNRSTDSVNQRTKMSLSPFRQNLSSNNRSGSPNLKTPDDSIFTSGPTKMMKLSKSISSVGPSKASSAAGHGDEDLEALDAPPVVIEKDEVHRAPLLNNQVGIGFTKPSAGAGSAFMDMVRKTTRRNRRSLVGHADNTLQDGRQAPPSPASTVQPGSPGFNLNEHGVSGPGRALDTPNEWMDRMARMSKTSPELPAQRYERAPASFTGSFETRVTSGHSDSSTMHPMPIAGNGHEADVSMSTTGDSEARDSASIYDRDLPPPPPEDKRVTSERTADPAFQDAEEVVDDEQRRSSDADQTDGSIDPYDGMADDEDTSGDTGMPAMLSGPSTTKELPQPINTDVASAFNGTQHMPTSSISSMSPTSPSSLIPRPLRSTSTSQAPDTKSKPLPSPQEVKELLTRPTIPVNGTGKVSQLAGKYGTVSAKSPKTVA